MQSPLALCLMIAALSTSAAAQEQTVTEASATNPQLAQRANDVVSTFKGEKPVTEIFSATFLVSVPPEQLNALTQQLIAQFGPVIGVSHVVATGPNSANIGIQFERAVVGGPMVLDTSGMVVGLLLNEISPIGDSAQAIQADLQQLPGTASAWFGPITGGPAKLAYNENQPLALGSTFKLYVLSALSHTIAAGNLAWDDVVRIDTKSYPSGVAQDWPVGSPATVQTLATLMIQISDNTATDQLIALLGRERVEAELIAAGGDAARTLPLLTTRELFMLKANPALRQQYVEANETQRRQLLKDNATNRPALDTVTAALSGTPVAIDTLEWFASAKSLGTLMQRLSGPKHETARAIMAANRAMGDAATQKWAYVGYKGGSEPGVLNLTWLLQDKAGQWHMLSLGWNNPAATVNENRLNLLVPRILALAD